MSASEEATPDGDSVPSSDGDTHYWTEHGVHSWGDDVAALRRVAHAAWHLLDEGGETTNPAVYFVSARDWRTLSDALDAAGWSTDPVVNARHIDRSGPVQEKNP